MSHRLQVILNPKEFTTVKREATSESKSISEWVRELIRQRIVWKKESRDREAIKTLKEMNLPAPPIVEMLKELA